MSLIGYIIYPNVGNGLNTNRLLVIWYNIQLMLQKRNYRRLVMGVFCSDYVYSAAFLSFWLYTQSFSHFIWLRHSESKPCQRWNRTCVPVVSNSFFITHPAHERLTTTPGTARPTLYEKCMGSLTSPANHVILKMRETGPTVYSPYPRRLERLLVCRYNYKSGTFSSVILRPWVLVRPGTPTLDLSHGRLARYQLS